MRRKNDSMWLLVCLCLAPDTHTPVPPSFQTQRVRLKPDKHTDKPDQSCLTDTHTHTHSQLVFGFGPWVHFCATKALCLDSHHMHVKHTHTHSFSAPWQHAELLPLTATVPVSHFTIHTLQPWLREQMGPSGETVNGQSMAENEASYKSHLSPLINAQSTVHRL